MEPWLSTVKADLSADLRAQAARASIRVPLLGSRMPESPPRSVAATNPGCSLWRQAAPKQCIVLSTPVRLWIAQVHCLPACHLSKEFSVSAEYKAVEASGHTPSVVNNHSKGTHVSRILPRRRSRLCFTIVLAGSYAEG